MLIALIVFSGFIEMDKFVIGKLSNTTNFCLFLHKYHIRI